MVEPLADGRYRLDLEAVSLEVKPARGGKYLIAPPVQDAIEAAGGGKWERSIKQWIAERLKSTEGESSAPSSTARSSSPACSSGSAACSWC